MYALADYLGEARLNEAIRKFRDDHAFKGPPYPSTTQFIARVREVTPNGRYEVTMKLVAKKRVADELGKESDVPIADLIDVGVLDAKSEAIAVERRRFDAEESTLTLVVDRKPAKAGIDPLNKLIDRKPNDNTVPVSGL